MHDFYPSLAKSRLGDAWLVVEREYGGVATIDRKFRQKQPVISI